MTEKQVLRGFLASFQVFPPLVLEFQFNPDTVRDNKAVRFESERRELGGAAQCYVGGGERTITFQLSLHGIERGNDPDNPIGLDNGVAPQLAVLRSFLYPRTDALGDLQSAIEGGSRGTALVPPPTCVFGFGTRVLECQVTALSVTETQFNQYLTPVRADVEVTLNVIEDTGNAFYQLDRVQRNLLAGRSAVITLQGGIQSLEQLLRGL
jgi:hypothetical protein